MLMLAEATAAKSPPEPIPSLKTVHPLLGVFGVLLGTMIATGTGRLISVGLADPRGAFAGFFQTVRLFGGQIGSALMLHLIPIREQFHSNILGLGVQFGEATNSQRLRGLRAAMAGHTTDIVTASGRADEILGPQVRQQAFSLAITDSFTLIAWASVLCLLVIACVERVPTQYRQVVAAPAGAP